MAESKHIDLYKQFRNELDDICIPTILDIDGMEITEILYDGKIVGILCTCQNYIDCVYVLPEHRRKGLAKKAVLDWVEKNSQQKVRLHIINRNVVAKQFWESLFFLEEVCSNSVDTLYEVVGLKSQNIENTGETDVFAFAQKLNGREYLREITPEEIQEAKELGFVVVFGYSDDNAEFRGAYCDEVGCYDGGRVYERQGNYVDAVWDKDGYSWVFETNMPCAYFDILEYGEKYCRGIVFRV